MTRKSRLFVFIVAASLPMIAACGEATTAPEPVNARKTTFAEFAAMGCGESIPWGKAPCIANGN